MAIAEGVRLARTISSSSRFAMKWRARTKTRPCSSHLAKPSYLLGSYFRHFDNLGETYGPPGAAIGLYVWFYLSGFAILVGGEINFLLGELKNHRTPQSSNPAGTQSHNLNAAA
jgi:Virulence factor BrkB